MSDRLVYIVDATNAGQHASVSHVYHYDLGCFRGEALGVSESIAKAFGRQPCQSCERRAAADRASQQLHDLLKEQGLPSLEEIAAALPAIVEMRLYITKPGSSRPVKFWSSAE